MSSNATAHLLYGYDLNGAEGKWRVQEADQWGYLDEEVEERLFAPEWLDEDDHGLVEALAAHLLLALPDSEEADVSKLAWKWNDTLKERTGLWFENYGHHDQRQIALVAAELESDCYNPKTVADLAADATPPLDPQAVAKEFARAAEMLAGLGLTPAQEGPCWMLCASYT